MLNIKGVEDVLRFSLKKIGELRKAKGISQRELARRINVSRHTIREWETGYVESFHADKVWRVADEFGIHWKDIVEMVDVPETQN